MQTKRSTENQRHGQRHWRALVDGQNARRIFQVTSGNVTFQTLRIKNGAHIGGRGGSSCPSSPGS